MKLKYRKAILLSLLSSLGMGILTLSISPDYASKDSVNVISHDNDNKDTENISPTNSLIATTAPLPVYAFENECDSEIKKLLDRYYSAKINSDVKTIQSLLTDPTQVGSKESLKKDIMFIEEYRNIKCYMKKSFKENEYVVFVYNDIKFFNIKTPAPAIDEFYIVKDQTGKYKIFSGEFDVQTKEYYHNRLQDEDVAKLINQTNDKGEKARKKDKNLKAFWDKYTAGNNSQKSSNS